MVVQFKGNGRVISSSGTSTAFELMAVFLALKYFLLFYFLSVKRLSCPSAGGQHSGSLLYKSPGRSALMQFEQNSSRFFSGPRRSSCQSGQYTLTDCTSKAKQSMVFRDAVSPQRISERRDLLSQAQGTIFHPRPNLWNLHAWPLIGTN